MGRGLEAAKLLLKYWLRALTPHKGPVHSAAEADDRGIVTVCTPAPVGFPERNGGGAARSSHQPPKLALIGGRRVENAGSVSAVSNSLKDGVPFVKVRNDDAATAGKETRGAETEKKNK
jgi:hypothetical protein